MTKLRWQNIILRFMNVKIKLSLYVVIFLNLNPFKWIKLYYAHLGAGLIINIKKILVWKKILLQVLI